VAKIAQSLGKGAATSLRDVIMPLFLLHDNKLIYQINSETVIGREENCIIKLSDSTVSRKHCRISKDDKGWTVADLGSSGGTFVNGDRLVPYTTVRLLHHETLQIGKYCFKITII
jgi:pSer/pThr/pTyr-binding forkhead associated (FHA) protein